MTNILLDSDIMQDVIRDENNVEEVVPPQLRKKGIVSIFYNAKDIIYTIIWKDYRISGHPKCISKIQINKEGFTQFADLLPDILYNGRS